MRFLLQLALLMGGFALAILVLIALGSLMPGTADIDGGIKPPSSAAGR